MYRYVSVVDYGNLAWTPSLFKIVVLIGNKQIAMLMSERDYVNHFPK